MPGGSLARRARRAIRPRTRWESWLAVSQVRRFHRRSVAQVRICWDLDNTLVGSGSLLSTGVPLERAIVDAEPIPNMLAFLAAMRRDLPEAEHVFLSARVRSMRAPTLSWLARYGLTPTAGAVWLVPSADVKPAIWRRLARTARLVIVDDLSYDHEAQRPSIYEDLVEVARQTATIYIGLDQIAEIAADPGAIEVIAAQTAEAVARPDPKRECF
jgi:hypothetical protein